MKQGILHSTSLHVHVHTFVGVASSGVDIFPNGPGVRVTLYHSAFSPSLTMPNAEGLKVSLSCTLGKSRATATPVVVPFEIGIELSGRAMRHGSS